MIAATVVARIIVMAAGTISAFVAGTRPSKSLLSFLC